jgi:hypothetical protein
MKSEHNMPVYTRFLNEARVFEGYPKKSESFLAYRYFYPVRDIGLPFADGH